MKSKLLFIIFFIQSVSSSSQISTDTITTKEVKSVINFLASDSLKGRANYSPELMLAAEFISAKFSEAKLEPFPSYDSYFQPFTTLNVTADKLKRDSVGKYDPKNILLNVIGVLPGKSLANEAIIFSAHYDHLGIAISSDNYTIFNGANDNASGTTALILLAKYFSLRADNERTLIFCAFAGEELGLSGSNIFADKVIANKIKAVINIEMIGKSISTRKKISIFITGADKSTFSKIFTSTLKYDEIKILKEPNESKQLYMRSDNFSFAQKGIPAHTISSSDDEDECYHKACDETTRLDLENMTKIIKAIAAGSQTIISGKDTPSRVEKK